MGPERGPASRLRPPAPRIPGAPCVATIYPSTINVTGGAATVNFSAPFSVKISGIEAPANACSGTAELGFLLQAPAGQFLEIMSSAGGYAQSVTGGYITLTSNSATSLPNPYDVSATGNWPPGASMSGNLGTYAPGSFLDDAGGSPTVDSYPSPGPGTPSGTHLPYDEGTGTFSSVFNGAQADGIWKLYLIDYDSPGCTASFTGWTLSFASTSASNATTSTTLSNATASPLTKGNSVTFTASVTNTSASATPTGTVTFTSTPYPSGSATSLCSAVALSGSGATATATCTPAPGAFTAENIFEINAIYNPGTGFSGGSTISPYYEWVNNPTTSGGTDVFCNSGTIAGTSETNVSPFPSVVTVSGISNAVQDVSVELQNYSFAFGGADAQLMLMAPNGSSAMVLMSNLNFGETSTVTNTSSVTFTDSGAPVTGGNPFAGNSALSYAPTALDAMPVAFIQTLPATPPSGEPTLPASSASGTYTGIGVPATVGTATLFSTFNGVAANGTWSLFAFTANQPMSISGGWCLAITPATGAATTTMVSGSPNPATTGATVAITATVSSGSTTPTGTVSFNDGLTNTTISGCGSVALSASGTDSATATCNVSTLAEGDHTITATYSGETGSFDQSIGSYDQRINTAITTSLTGGVLTYCNTGAIQIPDPNSVSGGAAYPNPSNIAVTGLFGLVNTVSVALEGFYATRPDLVTSLLVGPGGNLDFFSGAGGDSVVSTISSILFEDTAFGRVPGTLGTGPYKPTSDPGPGGAFPPMVFTSSPFYTVPGTIHSAASNGSSTFATSFGGTAPNGNWDLYFYFHDNSQADASNGLSGWCLNITPNVPTFTITETHSPASFIQGSTGQITLNVNNTSAAAVTSGGSAYPVTITDVLPNGLTYASISGAANDWSCSGATTVTCTNPDVVPGGSAYDTLVLNLNVSGTATGGNNPTEVSEGAPGTFGTATALSSADNIPVVAAPIFSVSEGYSGTFEQGVAGGTLTVTVSNTASASSSTSGTTTVTETLPTGYTAASFTGTGWSCSGNNSITCASTQAVAGGASFNMIGIAVSVPVEAPNPTTTNAATASGGGALASATSGTVTFPVVQLPATMAAVAGSTPQTAAVGAAFANALSVTVRDAGGFPVAGVSVTFTAPASGASGTFNNSAGTISVTTNAIGVATAPFMANSNAGGPYTVTATATGLSVDFSLTNLNVGPTVTVNPLSTTVNAGSTATFTAAATGTPTPTVQWQVSTNGGATFTNISGAASTTLSFTALASQNGYEYQAVFINSGGSATTAAAALTVDFAPAVTTNPLNQSVTAGQTATFTAAATGNPAPTVQWQVSTNGGATFTNISGASSTTLSFTTSASQNGNLYRAVFTNTGGSATTTAATLTVNPIPTVVSFSVLWGGESFNVIGSSRNRLPWQITGIQVVFSAPIATGNLNSLSGVTATGFSGLGTSTLTWTISPLALGNFQTTLAGSGANALKDAAGTALAGGAGFSQNLKILYGDFNDDGVVNSQDLVLEAAAISAPYNICADMNGDGVVSSADYLILRSLLGRSLP